MLNRINIDNLLDATLYVYSSFAQVCHLNSMCQLSEIRQLVTNVRSGDTLLLYCEYILTRVGNTCSVSQISDAGHGHQIPCRHNTEDDQMEEGQQLSWVLSDLY